MLKEVDDGVEAEAINQLILKNYKDKYGPNSVE